MPKAFNVDLGAFDPVFPGISLHYPNQELWDRHQFVAGLIAEFIGSDVIAENPDLRRADLTGDRLVRQILDNPDYTAMSDERRAMLADALLAIPDQAVGNLALVSAHIHERRHFHDWLLSPYTASINALRVEIALNLAQLSPFLVHDGATVLPVPISRWLDKSPDEREALIGMWRTMLGGSVDVRIADFEPDGIRDAIAQIVRRYRSIDMLFENLYGSGLSAVTVFEASAIAIQTQDIHDRVGADAANLFFTAMAGEADSPYAPFLRVVAAFVRDGEMLENDSFSPLVTWCLMGNPNADGANAHPITRMVKLIDYLRTNGIPPIATPARTIFEQLDRAAGTMPYDESLRQSLATGDQFLAQFREAAGEMQSDFADMAVETYAYMHGLHRHMVEHVLADLDGYTKPTDYLDRTLGVWPEPPVRHTFGQPFRRLTPAQAKAHPDFVSYGSGGEDGGIFVREEFFDFADPRTDLAAARNWQLICAMADVVFAQFNRDQPALATQKDSARREGLFMLEVLA